MTDRSRSQWRQWVANEASNGRSADSIQEGLIAEGWDEDEAARFVNDVLETERQVALLPDPRTIIKASKALLIVTASLLSLLGLLVGGLWRHQYFIAGGPSLLYFAGLGYAAFKGKLWSWGVLFSVVGLGMVALFLFVPLLTVLLLGGG